MGKGGEGRKNMNSYFRVEYEFIPWWFSPELQLLGIAGVDASGDW